MFLLSLRLSTDQRLETLHHFLPITVLVVCHEVTTSGTIHGRKKPGMITLALVVVLLLSPWPEQWSTDQQAVQTIGWSLVGNLLVPSTGNAHCSYSMLAFAESLPVSSAGIYEQGLTALGSLSRLRSNQKPSNLAYTGYATGEAADTDVKQGVASHRHLLGRGRGRTGRNGGTRRRRATRDLLAWESMSVHSRRVISKPRR